jgi:hypothetical protein
MAKLKFPRILIINSPGAHGRFLLYALDRFCTQTPKIDQLPFNQVGNSHAVEIDYSDQFVFYHGYPWECDFKNQPIIFMDISGETLYYERASINRSDGKTDLFSETAIANFLREHGNKWPDDLARENISIREGYMYGFKNLEQQGSMVLNKQRIEKLSSGGNNLFLYNVSNFFNIESFKKSFEKIGQHFGIEFELTGIDDLYKEFYARNTILQSHGNVQKYLSGDKTVQLDILQQAYVDAQKN